MTTIVTAELVKKLQIYKVNLSSLWLDNCLEGKKKNHCLLICLSTAFSHVAFFCCFCLITPMYGMVPHLMLPQMSSVIYSNEHIDSKKSSHIMLISVCSSWRIVDGETYSMKDLALSLCGLIQRPGSKLRNLSVSHVSQLQLKNYFLCHVILYTHNKLRELWLYNS